MSQTKRIVLLMNQDLSFCRELMRGIRTYAVNKSGWTFRNGPAELQMIPYLRDWRPHGIIANLYTSEVARHLTALRKPLVDTACTLEGLKIPAVDVDHEAVGSLAARYFLQRGFTNFGFAGSDWARYSKLREKAYRETLAGAGYDVSSCHGEYVYYLPTMTSWKAIDKQVKQWLRRLPKPVAIFSSNDIVARNMTDICRQLGLRVPDQVAILGADNDELECMLSSPPLSSIEIPAERVGFEAAQLLDELMSGGNTLREPIYLQPIRVIMRQSTESLAIEDSAVAAAITYMRQHFRENLSVAKIAAETQIVRRDLERKFRKHLGSTVAKELRRIRVVFAKGLLSETGLQMPAIAKNSGFPNAQRLAVVFHEMTGLSPSTYRKQIHVREAELQRKTRPNSQK